MTGTEAEVEKDDIEAEIGVQDIEVDRVIEDDHDHLFAEVLGEVLQDAITPDLPRKEAPEDATIQNLL